ncbi:PD-(D/E)XK nuclease family protein [Candidatus Woesearchaeota archaeon]|nr:PD-(D/E)XK nuclease family protein [Candidatus Woesearchaeota archaeon]MBW3016375.1 PD-(D/E)XK nuclease family protein [Candidatus Woesearchaeota archaeon]
MQKRVQSPSSIKTYNHCPRKYYYTYILQLETPPNIHQVRGNIAHSVLEHFFDVDTKQMSMENYEGELKLKVQQLLLQEWQNAKPKLDYLQLTQDQKIFYFEETLIMLFNWLELFCTKIEKQQGTFQERFKKLTPEREKMFVSEKYSAKGIIDAIESQGDGTIRLMDYKTSSTENMNEHLLQLAIYCLLYFDKHGTMPKHAGVYFLKGKERLIDVDVALLEMAKKEIEHIHSATKTTDVNNYPKNPGPLCKWSSGHCAFYDICRPHE